MKKINLILGLTALLVFGCSSDDDSNGGGVTIFGTYTLTSLVPSSTIDADANGTFDTSDIIDLIDCNFVIVLSDDNTFTANLQEFGIFQGATISSGPGGVDLDLDPVECDAFAESGTFTVNDGSIVLSYGGDPEDQEIISISNNVITLIYTEFFHTSENSLNSSSVQFTARFTKQ